ncbi:MAG: AAA family ATPase [Candidatus Zixiibacteriota bacterium]
MKLKMIHIRNFRRFEDAKIDFDDGETIFVGPNNSGKTSATVIFRFFLKGSEFRIHDFAVSSIRKFDHFGSEKDKEDLSLPSIDLDLWFKINPDKIEFGRVFSLLPNTLCDLDEIGIRIKFAAKQDDINGLVSAYDEAKALKKEGAIRDEFTLSRFLGIQGNLKRFFRLHYYVLEKTDDESLESSLDPSEAERVLSSLIRIDFVDAQRNIDDQEASRSNRLSSAFATFYKHNLEEPAINEAASKVIDENNQSLSEHYEMTFRDLMKVISRLGVPSVNDRSLKIVSTLNPEVALKGNTELFYIDPLINHELPEAYNGLGFKNLIYIAVQVTHYHLQWINTKTNRPICHLVFIEEPEVHLHAQVQQTFITNIWNILKENAKDAGEETLIPQLCVTTHSSHILDAVEFHKVRYFRRCLSNEGYPKGGKTLHASTVISLHDFQPKDTSAEDEEDNRKKTLKFLKQYLKLTHCDLFFADAAVLVEGIAEKLLLPKMIEKVARKLRFCYLTILEVGGAYAHRFAELFKFIGIPYLIITDCDSIDPTDSRKSCRADTIGAKTSNACLKYFYGKDITIEQLNKKQEANQILEDSYCYLTFQKPVSVDGYRADEKMHGRTFEEAFIYENISLFKDGKVSTSITSEGDHDKDYGQIYELVKSEKFKKAEFALDIVFSENDWKVPHYIKIGLVWLESRLENQFEIDQEVLDK